MCILWGSCCGLVVVRIPRVVVCVIPARALGAPQKGCVHKWRPIRAHVPAGSAAVPRGAPVLSTIIPRHLFAPRDGTRGDHVGRLLFLVHVPVRVRSQACVVDETAGTGGGSTCERSGRNTERLRGRRQQGRRCSRGSIDGGAERWTERAASGEPHLHEPRRAAVSLSRTPGSTAYCDVNVKT